MKYALVFFSLIFLAGGVKPASSATVTCQVKAVKGDIIILENCDEKRAKDFKQGDKVKVKQEKSN